MKKCNILLVATCVLLLGCACSVDKEDDGLKVSENSTSSRVVVAEEPVVEDIADVDEDDISVDESVEEVIEEDSAEQPGDDVVHLVNLRGDETTVYKLVDGEYMDRIKRIFKYDGNETWTDEDGVEWSRSLVESE